MYFLVAQLTYIQLLYRMMIAIYSYIGCDIPEISSTFPQTYQQLVDNFCEIYCFFIDNTHWDAMGLFPIYFDDIK